MISLALSLDAGLLWNLQRVAKVQLGVGAEGRNRTEPSPTTSLNTLIYKGILTLIVKGFKPFLALHATYRT
jgi:hypothetical protein